MYFWQCLSLAAVYGGKFIEPTQNSAERIQSLVFHKCSSTIDQYRLSQRVEEDQVIVFAFIPIT